MTDDQTFHAPASSRRSLPPDQAPKPEDRPAGDMELLAPFLELSFALLSTVDFDGYFRWVNGAWEERFGYTEEELQAQPVIYYVHPDDRQATLNQLKRLADGQEIVGFESRFRARDGEYRWLLWSARPVSEKELIYAAAQDITARKKIEQALLNSERRLASIVELAGDAIIVVNEEQEIVFLNNVTAQLFGYSTAELLGESLDLLLPAGYVPEQLQQLDSFDVETSRREMGKFRRLSAKARDGTEFPIEVSIGKTEVDERKLVTVVLRDITERDWAERALLNANAQLEESTRRSRKLARMAQEASQAKSAFLANMSHEIRTPMNAIIGMSSLLQETSLTAEQQEYVEMVRRSSESLLELINDLLDFSKIEAGRLEIEEQPFNLRDAVETSLDLVAVKAAEKGLDLAYYLAPGTPALVIGDVTRLRQMLVNLLANAVKFTEAGEVVVKVEATALEASVDEEGTTDLYTLSFAVRDTGIGVAPGQAEEIFQPFSQADAATARHYGGTGLGLSIGRQLAEAMGGRMWVESEGVGQGSTFFFTVQVQAPQEQPPACMVGPQPELAGKRLLVVDDNRTQRQMIVECARTWGLMVHTAGSAREALSLLEEERHFDLILLDMQLQEQVAQAVRELATGKTTRLVGMVPIGKRRPGPEDQLLKTRIHKPVRAEILYETLLRLVGDQTEMANRRRRPEGRLDERLAKRHPLRILVAEDNLINQKVVLRILQKLGYGADAVADGQEVLEALRRRPYDLVLMDVRMPRMDGVEATRQIRAEWPPEQQPRIVAMTASARVGERERFLAAGMDDYVSKPVRIRDLVRALESTGPLGWADSDAQADLFAGPVLDPEALQLLHSVVNEKPEMFAEMVTIYLEKSDSRLARIAAALAAEEAYTLEFEAHSFKSVSATLGALRLAAICEQIEQLAEAWPDVENPAIIQIALEEQVERLAGELTQVQTALRAELDK